MAQYDIPPPKKTGLTLTLRIMFTAKTRHFQGCLRVWSRGHQVRGHPGKLGKFAIFYHAKKISKNLLFPLFS